MQIIKITKPARSTPLVRQACECADLLLFFVVFVAFHYIFVCC